MRLRQVLRTYVLDLMADGVRPDHDSVPDILKRSHALWLSYTPNSDFQYPVDLRSLLARVPAFPRSSSQVKEQSSTLKYNQLFSTVRISGTSSWQMSRGDCELPPKIIHHDLPCGFTNSVACYFATSCPSINWLASQADGEDTDESHRGETSERT